MLLSKERTENRRNLFHYNSQTQATPAQLGVEIAIGAFQAVEDKFHLNFPLGEALGMRMPWVLPMLEQALAILWAAPEQPAILELGILLKMDAVDKHATV